jgi:hypothetical protein
MAKFPVLQLLNGLHLQKKFVRHLYFDWCNQANYIPAFVNPYIFSILPAGTLPLQPSDSSLQPAQFNQTALIQIRSSLSLQHSQTLPFPFDASVSEISLLSANQTPTTNNAQIRLMTPSPGAKSPLFVMTTSLDKNIAATEGSSLWRFDMKPWLEQLNELVLKRMFSDALSLLDILDERQVSDKVI